MQDKATDTDGLEESGGDQGADGYDSDATVLYKTPEIKQRGSPRSGSTSLESVCIMDPDYSGPGPQSQPCMKHGIMYTPVGMKKVHMKKRKLEESFDRVDN